MPSSKGSSNSNKTAHVMNLLRKNSPAPASHAALAAPEVQEAPVSAPAPEAVPQPAPAPQAAPIITALNADSEISSQIRDALTEELAQEAENEAAALPVTQEEEPLLTVEPPVSKPDTVQESEPAVQPEPEPIAEPEPIPVESKQEPIIEPVVKVQDPEPIADEAPAPDEAENMLEPKLVNVMHQIVEDKADKYIRLFNVCPCPRCRNDVIALTLNQLPAKYVVMNKAELLLKSDMYEVRYNCEIVAQLMNACQIVKDNPRHKI